MLTLNTSTKNFVSLFILKFFQIGTNFILLPFLIRKLGPEGYGHITYANSIIVYFTILVTYGFNYSSVHAIATAKRDYIKITKIVNTVFSAKIYLIFLSILIVLLLSHLFSSISQNIKLIYCYFLLVVGDSIFPQFFFQGIQQMDKISKINIGIKLCGLLLIVLFVHADNDILLVPFFIGMTSIIGGYYGYIVMKKSILGYSFRLMSVVAVRKAMITSTPYFLVNIAATIKDRTSSVLIASCISYSLAAYYEIAQKVVLFMATGIGILGQVFYPIFATHVDVKRERRIFSLFLLSGVILCLILIGGSKFIYYYLGGKEAVPYYQLIDILAFSLLFLSLSTYWGTLKIGASGHGKSFSRGVFGGLIIYFLGVVVLFVLDKISVYTLSWLYVLANFSEMLCFFFLKKKLY
ncbi:oligosaccharide flippase family protein [Bacteroides sp. KH569_7]|uniref:Oligosaccharide flippase family protein n=1 Tax=Bacteroides muris (ex Fokt et al. 2023) TaxID=2937417 RepID=A0A9X2SWH3_9BACE|nr:oligosaccharide flippase family protein [Bacteroides muris (ex Fokt et al. 2023)]MCR6508185.1 oligosaccharide flippase family protein [Bacteroides muris (ex Fokt et al. 2023)]